MEETKPWYLSKTIVASLLIVVVSGLAAFGVSVEAIEGEKENLADLLVQLGTAVAGLVAVYGRVTASAKIKGPTDEPQ